MATWEEKWQMEFHPDKCEIINITRNRTNIIKHNYNLRGHPLQTVDQTKYLGITINRDLKWNKHITNITNKANSTLAFLRRNLRVSNPRLKSIAYKALVRPRMEYAATVWDPHTKKCINALESVQRRAARWTLNKYRYGPNTTTVSSMLQQLDWPLLSTRRKQARLTMLYKIVNNIVKIKFLNQTKPLSHSHNTRYKKQDTLTIPDSYSNQHKFSFFPNTIRDWNNLPQNVTNSTSLDLFKSRLTLSTN
jgi:hypothetical protein